MRVLETDSMMGTAEEPTRFPPGGWRDREERRDLSRHCGSRDPWTFGSKEEKMQHKDLLLTCATEGYRYVSGNEMWSKRKHALLPW
jgi:hypothetical protein